MMGLSVARTPRRQEAKEIRWRASIAQGAVGGN